MSEFMKFLNEHKLLVITSTIGIISIPVIAVVAWFGLPYMHEYNNLAIDKHERTLKINLEREEMTLIASNKDYRDYKLQIVQLSNKPPVEVKDWSTILKDLILTWHENQHLARQNGWVIDQQLQSSLITNTK